MILAFAVVWLLVIGGIIKWCVWQAKGKGASRSHIR